MVKATLRSAVLLALIAISMLAVSMPSFAEVQNVKVGGDVTVRGFHRENLDLHQDDQAIGATSLDDEDDFFSQTTGINVSADLTENVSTFVRIVNERDWGTTGTANGDIDISQGFVKIKDLFYSPLTLTVGSQPIVWGRGLVVGSTLIPGTIGNSGDRNSSIEANEFTDFTAFDAIRLQGDFSGAAAVNMPVYFDAIYAKINEGAIGTPDDVNLLGINIGTKMDAMHSELETYYLLKHDGGAGVSSTVVGENRGNVSTIGIRGSAQPVEGSYLYSELAYQFGQRAADPSFAFPSGDAQQAWMFDLGFDYTLKDVAMTPKLGAEWLFWSGKDAESCGTAPSGSAYCGGVSGWDPIARGYFTTAIREFQTGGAAGGFYSTTQARDTSAATNQHQLALYGSIKPIEDLTIAPRLTWFVLDKGVIPSGANGKRESYAGMEWDTVTTYNYTDDVQFGLIYALFSPGTVYRTPNDSTAQELITTVSLKF